MNNDDVFLQYLKGISDGQVHRGALIDKYNDFRICKHRDFRPSIVFDTREGESYPKYKYIDGFYLENAEKTGPVTYSFPESDFSQVKRWLEEISRFTSPFVTIISERNLEIRSFIYDDIESDVQLLFVNNRRIHEEELSPSEYWIPFEEIVETKFDVELETNKKVSSSI